MKASSWAGVALVFAFYAFQSERPPVGDMFAYFFLVFSLYAPLKNLSRLQHQLALARQGVDPAYELLAIKSNLPEPASPKPLKAQGATIRFENVGFSYGEKAVLRDINLTKLESRPIRGRVRAENIFGFFDAIVPCRRLKTNAGDQHWK